MIELQEGEYYWIKCKAYEPDAEMFVAMFDDAGKGSLRGKHWQIGDTWINHDGRVEVLRHIPKPRLARPARIAKAQAQATAAAARLRGRLRAQVLRNG